ncbi:MAG: hypothetical protein IPP13_28040 [Kouleothrix sp.]|jgi:cytochrome b|nr:hypothetical protein [Kouleothrix sp.]MBK9945458.1 hypothetical protein [Kouleothrix sp.]
MWIIVVILLAALLSSSGAAPSLAGFVVGVALGLMVVYRLGWNARGDYDAEEAKRAVDSKNQAGRM